VGRSDPATGEDQEVREWRPEHRGPFLIHVSGTLDWKTAELLGYDGALSLPRGVIAAIADIQDVIEFTPESWIQLRPKHRVIHPPVREPLYGLVLGEILSLQGRVSCRGRRMFFPLPKDAESRVKSELSQLRLLE
jgi:hypothetical protein